VRDDIPFKPLFSEKELKAIFGGSSKVVTFVPASPTPATSTASTPAAAPVKSFGIVFAFPSGEFSVEWFATEAAARGAAGDAAHEAPGRVVHVVERKAAVMLPENALSWS
jgi:hypothetical protein